MHSPLTPPNPYPGERGLGGEGRICFSSPIRTARPESSAPPMRDQLLNLVNPVIRTGLRLRDDWSRGAGPSFDAGRELLVQTFRDLFATFPVQSASTRGEDDFPENLLDR